MSSLNAGQIDGLTKDIADLRKSDAREAKKEADLLAKLHRATEAARRTNSASTLQTRVREVERLTKDLAAVGKKRADLAGKIADKSKSLRTYEERWQRDEERERKKIADEQRKLMREREAHERWVSSEMKGRAAHVQSATLSPEQEDHDFFISHASEDKDGFVRELADALQSRGARVWYDDFTLRIGDSLRRNIDRGLAGSRFGVVVLSEHFFRKEWTNKELDGLVALEVQGRTRILPIWHKVSKDEVANYSPMLADKVALNTSLKSIGEIADELMGLLA